MITTELDINIVKQIAESYFHRDIELERTNNGLSTYVYRIISEGMTYYLRILPEDSSFAVEAKVHEVLINRGVAVPEPLYYEHKNVLVGKSIFLTGEIPGKYIHHDYPGRADILHEAGKQLALINSLSVDGFGWINRKIYDKLSGEKLTFNEYFYDKLYNDVNQLGQYGFDVVFLKTLFDNAYLMLNTEDAFLVHGDFDESHIYHDNGKYTGIIDFGEIRGSHYLYDLGHFRLHENDNDFEYLVEGYDKIHKLSSEDYVKIDLLALFIGIGRSKYEHYRKLVERQLEIVIKVKG